MCHQSKTSSSSSVLFYSNRNETQFIFLFTCVSFFLLSFVLFWFIVGFLNECRRSTNVTPNSNNPFGNESTLFVIISRAHNEQHTISIYLNFQLIVKITCIEMCRTAMKWSRTQWWQRHRNICYGKGREGNVIVSLSFSASGKGRMLEWLAVLSTTSLKYILFACTSGKANRSDIGVLGWFLFCVQINTKFMVVEDIWWHNNCIAI